MMQPFDYTQVHDAGGAIDRASGLERAAFIAGGTDLMQLMKEGAAAPHHLIDINALPYTEIDVTPEHLRLGALARMSDVADQPAVREQFPAIVEALLASASPQVRNAASIGGNLLQRTRCGYFRDTAMPCNKRLPGSGCSALHGDNRLHAIFGGSDACVASHPSDLAVALVAFDAVVDVQGPVGRKQIPIAGFHRVPRDAPGRDTVLESGELIVGAEVAASEAARRSCYIKVRDRASFEFALVSVAAGLGIENGEVVDARLAAGGVGTIPWRLPMVEQALVGRPATAATYREAAERAAEGAQPLAQNAFKVELLRRVVRRALERTGGTV